MLFDENLNPIMIGSELAEFGEILKKYISICFPNFCCRIKQYCNVSKTVIFRVTKRLEDFFNKYFNTIFSSVDFENVFIQ